MRQVAQKIFQLIRRFLVAYLCPSRFAHSPDTMKLAHKSGHEPFVESGDELTAGRFRFVVICSCHWATSLSLSCSGRLGRNRLTFLFNCCVQIAASRSASISPPVCAYCFGKSAKPVSCRRSFPPYSSEYLL